MSSFSIYLIGTIIVIAALSYGGIILGLPPVAVAIGAAVILGLGLMGAVRKTREKDETPTSE